MFFLVPPNDASVTSDDLPSSYFFYCTFFFFQQQQNLKIVKYPNTVIKIDTTNPNPTREIKAHPNFSDKP